MLFTEPSHDLQLCRQLDYLRFGGGVCGFRRRFGQTGAMTVHCLLDRLAEIGPQMIAISDLLGLRRSDACALRVTAGPVPADHLHLGVVAQPCGEVFALAAVVEMQWTVGGHVDQHRAVVTALAEGEVVDTEDLHLADLPGRAGPDQPQQRVLADGDADRGGQAGSCPAGQGQTDLRQHPAQQRGLPTVRGGQSRRSVRRTSPPCRQCSAAEPAYA